jgi:predicted lipoprotein with Yx(FWY)xxD motif
MASARRPHFNLRLLGGDPVKRTRVLLVGVLLAVASVSSLAIARGATTPARSALFFTVELHKTHLGKVLAASSGYTLYVFTKDRKNQDECAKIKGCLEAWPPKESQGKPAGGPGIRAGLLSTVKLPNGGTQVAYAGHPLYIYAGDSGPGKTSYVGAKQFGGTWYAINAAGQEVK